MKMLSVESVRDLGILQEINRVVLHPLGYAMEIEVPEDLSIPALMRIQDWSADPEGMVYDAIDQDKQQAFDGLVEEKRPTREAAIGYFIQPKEAAKK